MMVRVFMLIWKRLLCEQHLAAGWHPPLPCWGAHTEPRSRGWSSSWPTPCKGTSHCPPHWCRSTWSWGTGPPSEVFHRCVDHSSAPPPHLCPPGFGKRRRTACWCVSVMDSYCQHRPRQMNKCCTRSLQCSHLSAVSTNTDTPSSRPHHITWFDQSFHWVLLYLQTKTLTEYAQECRKQCTLPNGKCLYFSKSAYRLDWHHHHRCRRHRLSSLVLFCLLAFYECFQFSFGTHRLFPNC